MFPFNSKRQELENKDKDEDEDENRPINKLKNLIDKK